MYRGYNGLTDQNLKIFFAGERRKEFLCGQGLITHSGEIIYKRSFRKNKYAQDLSSTVKLFPT